MIDLFAAKNLRPLPGRHSDFFEPPFLLHVTNNIVLTCCVRASSCSLGNIDSSLGGENLSLESNCLRNSRQ